MDALLLPTKVRVPPQRGVRRDRLIDALERGIPLSKLTVLSAPAGYGKTVLLAQWAHTSDYRIAWLSLSAEDNDFERFFRYVLASWSEIEPEIWSSPLGLLLSGMTPDHEAVLAGFVDAANSSSDPTILVLDDYHLIQDPAIHQALTWLLDYLPTTFHLILAARAEPALPLARFRAHGELLEFRDENLQFSQDETEDFLNGQLELDLPPEQVSRLQTQLEGWIAGLQLVSLTLEGHGALSVPPLVTGKHRFIADYLGEDVLAHLPEDTREFLLRTSILERLCSSLCDAVTGEEGGQEMLQLLERQNLFLVHLDNDREWFRYHRVFADFLQSELHRRHPDQVSAQHHRAAQWHLAHDLPEQALQHAIAGADVESAIQIFDQYFNLKLNTGELGVIKRWLESLPEHWLSDYPMFGLARAGLFAFTGDLEACVRTIEQVEERLMPADDAQAQTQLAKAAAVRCAIACLQNNLAQAETYGNRALHDLQDNDDSFLHLVHGALGDAYRGNGRWQEARQCYLKVLSLPYGPLYRIHSVHAFGALADLELRQGRLREAAGYWKKALAGIEDRANFGTFPLPLIGWVYIRMGEILYEWNELAQVGNYVFGGLERAELGGDVQTMLAGYLLAGRLKLSEGDIAAAGEYLEKARPIVENASFPEWTSRFERFQLESWLAQNLLRAAISWVDERLRGETFELHAESEEAQFAFVRALIEKGDLPALEQSLAVLVRLVSAAEAEGREGILVEGLALQALGEWRRGDRAIAMTSLERAMRLAEPEGYLRRFIDLGLPMARLLQEARSRKVMPDYVGRLLDTFGAEVTFTGAVGGALPEPLSPREQEILKLLAAGLTNREIAEQLVISPETVKKHTGTIYSKLGVINRTEAAARARDLHLLD